jgi:hypothetical protein
MFSHQVLLFNAVELFHLSLLVDHGDCLGLLGLFLLAEVDGFLDLALFIFALSSLHVDMVLLSL